MIMLMETPGYRTLNFQPTIPHGWRMLEEKWPAVNHCINAQITCCCHLDTKQGIKNLLFNFNIF